MPREKKTKFSKSSVLVSLGVTMLLCCVLLLLSPRTRLRYLTYPVHFLFGSVGFWLLSLLLGAGAMHLILHKVWRRDPLRLYFGVPLSLIGLWLLLAKLSWLPGLVEESGFAEALNAAYVGDGGALYFGSALSGGFLGNGLLSFIDHNVGSYLSYIVSGALLALGLFLIFLPLIVKATKAMRASAAVSSAKRAKRKEEEELRRQNDFVIEPDDEEAPLTPSPMAEPSMAPGLNFAPSEEGEEESAPISLAPDYVFAPAGGSTLPSRKQIRAERAKGTDLSLVQGDPAPVASPFSPQEIVSPPRSSYSANPIRSSGLQEALFNPDGDSRLARAAFPAAPTPVSMPLTPEAPKPVSQPLPATSPAQHEEPVTLSAHEPDPKPSLSSRLTPRIDAHPSPVEEPADAPAIEAPSIDIKPILEEEAAEEEAYVPPSNDPIVLAPNTGIITPSTLSPKIEPMSEEPASKEGDDLEGPLPPYVFPSADLLADSSSSQDLDAINEECRQKAEAINQIFVDFGVGAHVTEFLVGPSITRYSIAADPGVSIAAISRVIKDMEVRLGGVPVRFVERVYGLACSALEVANETRRVVSFKETFLGLPPRKDGPDLHIPFGIDISGKLQESDLAKFPHMLVAGTSGSGKSIFAHGILMSLIMRNRPEDLKLVLIDPKRGVEMAPYKDLPHLLCPIIKEAKPAKNALKKLCDLMDQRYDRFSEVAEYGVRDIKSYNAEYAIPNGKKRMSYIVVFVDEFADLVGECKEISEYVLRIAQKARACGIHLIVATQRPDVKVITGTIKSNLLCRVALTVASSVDSQTILGVGGAEDLYGYGDMLIDCQELSKRDLVRAQGCLAVAKEMKNVCDFIRKQLPPNYDKDFLDLEDHDEEESSGPEIRDGGYAPVAPTMSSGELRKMADEEKYQFVKSVIMTREFCSISMIQREFEVGFPRAGKILARLQNEGIVASPGDTPNNSRGCRVLVHSEDELGGGGDGE